MKNRKHRYGLLFGSLLAATVSARGASSATIVPGSLVQGDVKSSMSGNSYASESNAMNDWCLDTGGWGGSTVAVTYTNPNFNGSSWGGTPNTMVAFGNGGSVTLRLDEAVSNSAKLGLFTAQAIVASTGGLLNGHMEASVLVSSDGVSWSTLGGQAVGGDYDGSSSALNAPTLGYSFGTLDRAWTYGSPGTSSGNLSALPVADYLSPMVDDSLFNGAGTNADRLAMKGNTDAGEYAAVFGNSGGGNWFDLSASGLDSIEYVRLNAVNCSAGMGVRLDAVYASVPEPSIVFLLAVAGLLPVRRRR